MCVEIHVLEVKRRGDWQTNDESIACFWGVRMWEIKRTVYMRSLFLLVVAGLWPTVTMKQITK